MFSKITPCLNYYFLPLAFFIPQKVFNGFCNEYNESKHENLTRNVFHSFMGGYSGLFEGVFLGLVWPISIPIMIKRYIDKTE